MRELCACIQHAQQIAYADPICTTRFFVTRTARPVVWTVKMCVCACVLIMGYDTLECVCRGTHSCVTPISRLKYPTDSRDAAAAFCQQLTCRVQTVRACLFDAPSLCIFYVSEL